MKNCLFFIGDSKEGLTYDQMRAYLVDNAMTELKTTQGKKFSENERSKEQVKSKIDDIAEKVKAKLKAKGLEGKDIELMGTGSDQIVDALANMAKKLVDAGYSVKEAIDTILESAKERLDSEEYKSVETQLRDKFKEEQSVNQMSADILEGKQGALASVAQAFVDSKMEDSKKKQLLEDTSLALQTMSFDELKKAGAEIISGFDSIEQAVEEAGKIGSSIPVFVRSMILGEGMKYAQEKQKDAKTQAEKDKWADYEIDIVRNLTDMARSMGRFNAYIQEIYKQSPYSIVRQTKETIEAKNKLFSPDAKKQAKEIKGIVETNEFDSEAVEQAVKEAFEQTIKDRDKRIKELEETLVKFGKEPKEGKPKNRKYIISENARKEALVKLSELSANPMLDPSKWKALGVLAAYHTERGYYKFEDFYKKMKKDLGGRYTENYGDLYENAKQALIESGVDPKEFDSEETVLAKAEEFENIEQKVKDEIEKLKKQNEVDKLSSELGRMMSVGLPSQSERVSKEKKLKAKAKELDDAIGGNQYSNLVNDFLGITEAEKKQKKFDAKLEAKEKAFQKKLSSTRKIDKLGPKDPRTENQKLLDEAKELDEAIGGDTYQRQALAFITSGQNASDLVLQGMLDAGFGKEVNGKQQVDWAKVTADSKNTAETVDKIRKALEGKIPQAQLEALLPSIQKRAEELIDERKKAAISAKVGQINRGRMNSLLNKLRRKTKIDKLLETWKQGGLTEKVILDKLASDFGVTTFTDENEKWIEDKLKEIDDAPEGAEKEILEEQLHAYLEDLSAPLISMNRILERNKARLLSGPITAIKNTLGGIDTQLMVLHQAMLAQLSTKGLGDKEALKIIKDNHRKSMITAMDILINGGVDTGSAFSEKTETKEGSPRVRYMENERRKLFKPLWVNAFGKDININPLNKEKYVGRFMSAMDSFSQVMGQEVGTYAYIKNDLMKKNPSLSNKEAARQAYDIMYSQSYEDAVVKIAEEFKNRGIDIDPNSIRFKRRVHESIEQLRPQEAVKAGTHIANRYTYKEVDAGITWPVIEAMMYLKKFGDTQSAKMKAEAIKTDNKLLYRSAQALKATWNFTFDWLTPFVKGVGNILEKGFELTAYGYAKSVAYGGAAVYNKLTGNKGSDLDFKRASEYSYRATVGMIVTGLIMSMLDDDEEDKLPAIYGEGSDNYQERANRAMQRPANTLRMFGKNIPIDLLGPFATNLRIKAFKQDAERYRDGKVASLLDYVGPAMNDMYLRQMGDLVQAAKDYNSNKEYKTEKYASKMISERLTRLFIPYTAAMRQLDQMIDPVSKVPQDFMDNIEKQSGVVLGFINGIPKAVDFMGNEFNVGDKYTSSASGTTSVLSQVKPLTKGTKAVLKYNPSLSQVGRNESDLLIPDANGEIKPLGNVDFFNFQVGAAKKFGPLMEAYANTNFENNAKVRATYKLAEGLSVSKRETYRKEAEIELMKEGKDPKSDQLVLAKMLELYQQDEYSDIVKQDISELNRMAKKAQIEEYLISRGIRVPEDVKNSIKVYENTLMLMKK